MAVETNGIVYGVCSVAEGADLLFAESCVQLGIPLRVLLPLPKEEFLRDFDAATRARAEQAIQNAISAEVTGDLTFPNRAITIAASKRCNAAS